MFMSTFHEIVKRRYWYDCSYHTSVYAVARTHLLHGRFMDDVVYLGRCRRFGPKGRGPKTR